AAGPARAGHLDHHGCLRAGDVGRGLAGEDPRGGCGGRAQADRAGARRGGAAVTNTGTGMRFRTIAPELTADALEQEVLRRWTRDGVFAAAQAQRADAPAWVFYEGPPTANGKPGIHHVFARTVKDLFCRHRAMHGYHVPRKAGWDTHGLPVEIEVEKQLGISGKQDIERIGVAEFNRSCRVRV